ncbi:MAG: ParA family protein [Candidatus Nanopelagicales bacterium]
MESQGFEGTEAGGQPVDVPVTLPAMDGVPAGEQEHAPPAIDPPAIDPRVDDPSKRGGAAIPEPTPRAHHRPARVIAMVNQKGGVGKTTSTVSLGAALASYGRKVLLVDFDPQGAVSVALGINPNELDLTIYDALTQAGCHVGDVVMPTDVIDLDLLPANIDLSAAEVQLVSEVGREHALGRVLAPIKDEYDIVLIDCQPSLGLLTLNALTAANGVIIPMGTEYFALRGVALLKDTIDKVTSRLNPDLEIIGVLPTMYDARTLHAREVLATVQQAFGDLVFQSVIHRTVKFQDAAVAGEPITDFAPGSPGAEAYRQLAREVLAR